MTVAAVVRVAVASIFLIEERVGGSVYLLWPTGVGRCLKKEYLHWGGVGFVTKFYSDTVCCRRSRAKPNGISVSCTSFVSPSP
jgi:hypothetical protein